MERGGGEELAQGVWGGKPQFGAEVGSAGCAMLRGDVDEPGLDGWVEAPVAGGPGGDSGVEAVEGGSFEGLDVGGRGSVGGGEVVCMEGQQGEEAAARGGCTLGDEARGRAGVHMGCVARPAWARLVGGRGCPPASGCQAQAPGIRRMRQHRAAHRSP